jgi:hypothetical protein
MRDDSNLVRRALGSPAIALAVACNRCGTPTDCPIAASTVAFGSRSLLHVRVADDDASRAEGLRG